VNMNRHTMNPIAPHALPASASPAGDLVKPFVTLGGKLRQWTGALLAALALSFASTAWAQPLGLTVNKEVTPAVPSVNNIVTYTIDIENTSLVLDRSGTTYSDPLPIMLVGTTANCSASNGALCGSQPSYNVNTNIISGAIATMPPGGKVTLTISGTIPSQTALSVANNATVTPPGGPSVVASVTHQITQSPIPALVITKAYSTSVIALGVPIVISVKIKNTGGTSAVGVRLEDSQQHHGDTQGGGHPSAGPYTSVNTGSTYNPVGTAANVAYDISPITCTSTAGGGICPAVATNPATFVASATNAIQYYLPANRNLSEAPFNILPGEEYEFKYSYTPTAINLNDACNLTRIHLEHYYTYARYGVSSLVNQNTSVTAVGPIIAEKDNIVTPACPVAPTREFLVTKTQTKPVMTGLTDTNTYTVKYKYNGASDGNTAPIVNARIYDAMFSEINKSARSFVGSTITCTGAGGAICPSGMVNYGPHTITGVPAGTYYFEGGYFNSYFDTPFGYGSYNNEVPSWPVGGELTLTVKLVRTLSETCAGTGNNFQNYAFIGSVGPYELRYDPATTNYRAPGNYAAEAATVYTTHTVPPASCVDLTIQKKINGAATSFTPGQTISFNLIVDSNAASSVTATGVPITDALPAGFVYQSSSCVVTVGAPGTQCPPASSAPLGSIVGGSVLQYSVDHKLYGTAPAISPGGQIVITIIGLANTDSTTWGANTNSASVGIQGGNYSDTNQSSNSSNATFSIFGQADVGIVKSSPTKNYVPNDPVTYDLLVTNNGPDDAPLVAVKDPAVASISVTGVVCTNPTGGSLCPAPADTTVALLQGATGIIIPKIVVGQSVTLRVTGTFTGAATGIQTNTASISMPGYMQDSVASNNTSSYKHYPAPTVTKAFTAPTTIPAGGVADLVFTITNPIGNLDVQGMAFADNLPVGLVIANTTVSNTCVLGGTVTVATGGSTVNIQNIGVPAATASATKTCTVTVKVTSAPGVTSAACPGTGNTTNGAANITGVVGIVNGITNQCLTITPLPVLTKAFSPTSIAAGGVTRLTFTITNAAGNAPVTGINFEDNLPSGLIIASTPNVVFTPASCAGSAIATAGASKITVSGVAVAAGAATCTVAVNVTNAPSTVLAVCPNPSGTNTTNGSSSIGGATNVTNGVTDQCVTITGLVNLNIGKAASTATPVLGTPFSYNLTVKNSGNADTSAIYYIADDIDAARLNVTAITPGTGWTCTPSSGFPITTGTVQVRCNSTTVIAAGATSSPVTITVTPTAAAATGAQPIKNVAAVGGVGTTPTAPTSGGGGSTAATSEPAANVNTTENTTPADPTTNVAALPLTFTGKVDLVPVKTVSSSAQNVGTPYTYTINVKNMGNLPSSAIVTITDQIPANIRLNSMTAGTAPGTWTCSSSAALPATAPLVTCTLPAASPILANGVEVTAVTLNVTALPGVATPVSNTATVSGGGEVSTDSAVTGNNTSTVPVNFVNGKIGIAKNLQSVTSSAVGTYTIKYRYKVRNDGTGNMPNVQVVDDLRAVYGASAVITAASIAPVAGSATCPSPTAAPTAWTVNAGYNGTGNNNFFTLPNTGLAALNCEASFDLTFTVSGIKPVSYVGSNTVNTLSFDNTATTSSQVDPADPATILATDSSMNSKTLDPKQGNAAVDANQPVNNVPTPVLLPAVGTAKAAGAITIVNATQIDVPYTVKVRNMGGTVLDPVTTIDNLATTFPGLTTAISVAPAASVTTAGNCSILQPYFGAITETAAANAAYNGQADTNLLALTGSKLCPGGEITITFTVRVTNPVAGTTYNNIATASGVGKTDPTDPNNPDKSLTVSDPSTNGVNPDPNGDGNPSENVPTPVTYTPQKIDVAKAAGVPTQTGASTFTVPYTVVVKNTGTIPATNVQVEDNLATTFATGAPVVTISTAAATAAPCTINPTAFNGVANTRLLVGTNTLAVGESCTITFTANVAYPSVAAIPAALQNNTAVANTYIAPPATPGGPSTGTPVATDTSTTGTPPPANSPPGTPPTTPTPVAGDTPAPTPVQFIPQKIDVVKAVGTYKQTGAKTFEVPYKVVVGNVGATSPIVYNVQADDNLKSTFPTASTITVSGYTVAAVAPTPAGSCTPAVPAYAGTAAASKMLSGTGDLAGGQACVITFIANVDFGANPVPVTVAQNNTVYASGVGADAVANPGYTVTDAGVATPPSVATTTDVSVDNVLARPPAGSPAGTPPSVPALPDARGADPAAGVPTPVLMTPQKIDVVKAAGVPLQVGPKKFLVDYSVVVGNVGAASPTVFNVQANDNLKVTYPTAASITVSNYAVAAVAPTPAANCTAATPAFAGTAAASAMLSGTNDLLGGQSCVITFKVLVDFGSAEIPVVPQNNTVYASGVGSDAVPNPGYTVTDTGVATPPAVATTTDVSVTAPPTKGDPGTPPAVPALPATPGADVPAGVPTPVVLVGQKIDTVKAVGVPKQVGPKVFEVNYSVVVANVCKASPLTCATTPTVFNVQANDNLANTFPTASSIVVSNYAVANGANGAVCSAATPAFAGTAAASAMLSGADDLTGGQTCIITFKATVDFGANPIPLTPQNNTVYASGTGANTIVNPGYTYGADGKPVPPANASTTDISATAPPTTGAPGTLPTTPVPPTLPGGDSELGIPTPIVLLVDDGGLNIVKSTVTKEASAGDVVVYSVTVTNTSSVAVANAKVTDTPPVGFVYVPGSAKIGGSSVTSSNNGSSIIFDIGTIAAKSSLVLTYQMKLGDAVEAGEASNCVSANGVSIFGFDKESGKSCATVIIKTGLFLEKRANVTKAEIGDSVEYSLRVKSVGGTTKNVTITDNLPLGFKLIDGTVKVIRGGVTSAAANPAGSPGPVLTFNVGTVVNKEVVEIRYRLRLGVGADLGDGINKAQAKAPYATSSLVATAKVLVTRGVFTREACIVGKVFVDCNQNKVQDKCEAGSKDACEPGIPGVRLYMEDGTNITTDENGQYSICGVRAITHVMQVDMTTMPVGSRMGLTSNENLGSGKSLMMNIKSGELHRADFIESSCYPKILEQVEQRRKNSAGIVNVPLIQKGQDKPGIVFDSKEQELLAPALRGVK
jgi:uncharacterized repeat protein (TIGR01451 family)